MQKTVLRPEIKAAALAMQKRMEENRHKDTESTLTPHQLMLEAQGQLRMAFDASAGRTEYVRRQLTDTMVYCALALAKLPNPGAPEQGGDR
jgi:hypothetical protein